MSTQLGKFKAMFGSFIYDGKEQLLMEGKKKVKCGVEWNKTCHTFVWLLKNFNERKEKK